MKNLMSIIHRKDLDNFTDINKINKNIIKKFEPLDIKNELANVVREVISDNGVCLEYFFEGIPSKGHGGKSGVKVNLAPLYDEVDYLFCGVFKMTGFGDVYSMTDVWKNIDGSGVHSSRYNGIQEFKLYRTPLKTNKN